LRVSIEMARPFDRWPTRQGFDKFYGFIGGETNQWAPLIYDGLLKVAPPHDPNYHFTTDMATQAITWVRAQQSLTPDKPFFIYFAPGATHAPHHVPKEWIARYAGKSDQGWDRYREAVLARQIALGVVPPGTKLAPAAGPSRTGTRSRPTRSGSSPARWKSSRPSASRRAHRSRDRTAGEGDRGHGRDGQPLFIYIAGDNGASAEGSMTGLFNETSFFNGVPEQFADVHRYIDRWGDPTTYPHYAVGWAVAPGQMGALRHAQGLQPGE